MDIANPPQFTRLFTVLNKIYHDAIAEGGIASGQPANARRVTQAIADAIDKAVAVPLPADSMGDLVRHLVNLTIPRLQVEINEARRSIASTSLALDIALRENAELKLKLDAMVPVRVVVTQDEQDTILVEIEDDANHGLRVTRHKHATNANGDFDAFKLWAHRDEIEEVL